MVKLENQLRAFNCIPTPSEKSVVQLLSEPLTGTDIAKPNEAKEDHAHDQTSLGAKRSTADGVKVQAADN